MNKDDDSGFLSRWSRRKALARDDGVHPTPPEKAPAPAVPTAGLAGATAAPQALARHGAAGLGGATPALAPAAPAVPAGAMPPAARRGQVGGAGPAPADPGEPAQPPAPPPPTLADAESLTPESDFRRFIRPEVEPEVKNLAMKKLFSDPHFNVMDGLDTYIDDYNTPDPLPRSVLRQLVHARALGLLDDELEDQPAPGGLPPQAQAVDDGGAQAAGVAAGGPEPQPAEEEDLAVGAADAGLTDAEDAAPGVLAPSGLPAPDGAGRIEPPVLPAPPAPGLSPAPLHAPTAPAPATTVIRPFVPRPPTG